MPNASHNVLDRIATDRLIGERMTPAFFDDLHRLYSDPIVALTLTRDAKSLKPEQTAERMRAQIDNWDRNGFGLWRLTRAEDGAFVGRGGLRWMEVGGERSVEVGYALLPEFWGVGFATEIARKSVEIAFTELTLEQLISITLVTNRRSRRVMEKAGFQYERDVDYAGLPHVLYRQARDDWRSGPRGEVGG